MFGEETLTKLCKTYLFGDLVLILQMMSPRYSATAISWPDRGMVCPPSKTILFQIFFRLEHTTIIVSKDSYFQ